jgi:glycosyltransferase involved in cell wall biosynthesis
MEMRSSHVQSSTASNRDADPRFDGTGMTLRDHFDSVVMLTGSDWRTEPRSNRYHYAARFAREVPVLFVQHEGRLPDGAGLLGIEPTALANVDLVHAAMWMSERQQRELHALLEARSLHRPLLWIYDVLHYGDVIESFPNSVRVLHATENYFIPSTSVGDEHGMGGLEIQEGYRKTLEQVDMVVAVSQGVADSIRSNTSYTGPITTAENGVDAEFYLDISRRAAPPSADARPAAIFQGGINARLDFELLDRVIRRMPDWDFRFCGREDPDSEGWARVRVHPNVQRFGMLDPRELGARMSDATVGIIPFVDDEWIRKSYPLKAFEYVACGLPVVTVPIEALARQPRLFQFATGAADFEAAIRSSVNARQDPALLELRETQSAANSYDSRFSVVVAEVARRTEAVRSAPKRLNVLVLYAETSTHISTIVEHLSSFEEYSKHDVYYLPATGNWSLGDLDPSQVFHLDVFDVVIVHYTVRICFDWHMNEHIADLVAAYRGLKVLFIQDEYNTPGVARHTMERLKFDLVYTCVPPESIEYVYPAKRFGCTEFIRTLTGFTPEDPALDDFALPVAGREIRVGYRGRELPFIYGSLGNEKYEIGVEVKRLAEERGLPVDIEVDDSKRIYGLDWFRFLGSARATLGTESGSNVFDFDGSIKIRIEEILAAEPDTPFTEVFEELLAEPESRVHMNQISPKVFEAIRLRTALILFEGEYSGLVQPDVHFIPLKKDYSNIHDVFAKLEDVEYLTELTDRAYQDIIASGRYTYPAFVEGVDRDLEQRVLHPRGFTIFDTPAFGVDDSGNVEQLLAQDPHGLTVSKSLLLRGVHQRDHLLDGLPKLVPKATLVGVEQERDALRDSLTETRNALALATSAARLRRPSRVLSVVVWPVRGLWRAVPRPVRVRLRPRLVAVARVGWRLLPGRARDTLRPRLKKAIGRVRPR